MTFDFTGKRAIICGGSRGIGRSIALGLAAAGADVSICARGAETLAATQREIAAHGHKAHTGALDLGDGEAIKACTTLALQAAGRQVTTIEGMAAADGSLHPIQKAFVDCHGLQCGFCTPGMVMACASLLSRTPQPDDDAIEHALEGNLCRCTGYVNIVEAVRQAASELSKP